jgi:site-specific recombinase XerD
VKNYLNLIKHFVVWVDVPVEEVTHTAVSRYIEYLMRKRLAPKTVNCHLNGIRQFYHYLREESHPEDIPAPSPAFKRRAGGGLLPCRKESA